MVLIGIAMIFNGMDLITGILGAIRDGEKLKFLYLTPNQFGFDVIGFRDKLPKEFGLHARVDKESHFDKAFKKPLSDMMEACGWQMVETATLDDFF